MLRSPTDAHASSAVELKARLEAEHRGRPFLIFRDQDACQVIVELPDAPTRLTVGRRAGSDLQLEWDSEVSRLHAELERIGDEWTLCDDGLSRNGSFVNGKRINRRRRLNDADAMAFGDTVVVFRSPGAGLSMPTRIDEHGTTGLELTPMQRKVLISLCRPFKDSLFAAPPANNEIAGELHLSVETVKTYLRTMFCRFGIEHLPQNQKRARLAAEALRRGVISPYEL